MTESKNESNTLPVPTKVEHIGSYLVQKGEPTRAGQRMLDVLPFSDDLAQKRFLSIGMDVAKNPSLKNCNPVSVLIAIYDVAKVGLSLNANMGEASIVPFKGEAKMITGYKGYTKLARRGGQVTSIEVSLVYQNDQFPVELGQRTAMQRWAAWDAIGMSNPGNLIGGFCRAIVLGSEQFHWVSVAEFEKAKASSASWRSTGEQSAWGQHYEAMCRKTVVRRASTLWPQTDEMAFALAQEAEAEGEQPVTPRRELAGPMSELGFDMPELEEEVLDADFEDAQEPESPAPEDDGFESLRRAYNALTSAQKQQVLQAAKVGNISEVKGDAERTGRLESFICDLIANK